VIQVTRRRGSSPPSRLRELLREAAENAFSRVMEPTLAAGLPDAFETFLRECSPALASDALAHLRDNLARFDQLGAHERAQIVALGLRLTHKTANGSSGTRQVSSRNGKPAPRKRLTDSVDASPVTDKTGGAGQLRGRLPGVGPGTAGKLAAAGLCTLDDLAGWLPVAYHDCRSRQAIADVSDGEQAVLEVEIVWFREQFFRGRYHARMEARQSVPKAPPETVIVHWFHRVGGLAQRMLAGTRVVLIGTIKYLQGRPTMAHPDIHDADSGGPTISLRYPRVEGVPPRTLARLCRAAVEHLAGPESGEVLPDDVLRTHRLTDRISALRALHMPADDLSLDDVAALRGGRSEAHRRLAFEDLFFLQLQLLRRRVSVHGQPCTLVLPERAFEPERLRACVPFEPTGAQWRVVRELLGDLATGRSMWRLLQGDVGSGKTFVAFACAWAIIEAGGQVAVMAPTEILAEQHLRTLAPWCTRAGLRVALLTGSTARAERASTLALLGAGQIDVVIGTHALLVGDVEFARLGLVVVDEQHRFGVEQRAMLRDKGRVPHMLVMTATPIPRTMALTHYGELDVSVLDERPPGRLPALTRVHAGPRALERARRELVAEIENGGQAFVVCPLVEASEVISVTDVEASAAALRKLLPKQRIEVVHGRLATRDKEQVMRSFRDGEIRILVATTIIEVGVDVPDARVMLVEHAERFGLAQLHQLRGRVGRGTMRGVCILHTAHAVGSDAAIRVAVLAETDDGIALAERDLELRGPGEVFGTRQAGMPRFRLPPGAGLRLLMDAREAASVVLERDPTLGDHPLLARELARRSASRDVFAGESG